MFERLFSHSWKSRRQERVTLKLRKSKLLEVPELSGQQFQLRNKTNLRWFLGPIPSGLCTFMLLFYLTWNHFMSKAGLLSYIRAYYISWRKRNDRTWNLLGVVVVNIRFWLPSTTKFLFFYKVLVWPSDITATRPLNLFWLNSHQTCIFDRNLGTRIYFEILWD